LRRDEVAVHLLAAYETKRLPGRRHPRTSIVCVPNWRRAEPR
jgi:hypothetical protein